MRNVVVFLLILIIAAVFADDSDSESSESLRFLLLGDWGKSGYNQLLVANSMATFASTYAQDFVLLLGDNFYSSGVQVCPFSIMFLCLPYLTHSLSLVQLLIDDFILCVTESIRSIMENYV